VIDKGGSLVHPFLFSRSADLQVRRERNMTRVTRNVGMLTLAIYLIAVGAIGVLGLTVPFPILPVLALVAGILILVGR
jgi:hypothetical protein